MALVLNGTHDLRCMDVKLMSRDLLCFLATRIDGPWSERSEVCSRVTRSRNPPFDALPAMPQCNVLELGCGHGLPGILCLLAGAKVVFHVRLSLSRDLGG
jgi:hypothetical protein